MLRTAQCNVQAQRLELERDNEQQQPGLRHLRVTICSAQYCSPPPWRSAAADREGGGGAATAAAARRLPSYEYEWQEGQRGGGAGWAWSAIGDRAGPG